MRGAIVMHPQVTWGDAGKRECSVATAATDKSLASREIPQIEIFVGADRSMRLPTLHRREHLLLAAAACFRVPPCPAAEPSFRVSQGVPELSNSIVASRDTNIS